MIFGTLGLGLNILTIGVLGFCIAVILMSWLMILWRKPLLNYEVNSRLRVLWCAVTIPWLASILAVVLLIYPDLLLLHDSQLATFVHWHHTHAFYAYSWHGASLAAFSVFCVALFVSRILKILKIHAQLNHLNYFVSSSSQVDGCVLVVSDTPQAFTTGLFRSRSYITSGLEQQLTAQEIDIVRQHELAHALHRDPLRKYIYSLLTAFFPTSLSKTLNNSFALSLEQHADQVVSKNSTDKALIASTILKVGRLQSQHRNASAPKLTECYFSSHPLTLRIQYLLSNDTGKYFPFFGLVAIAAIITVMSTLSVDFLHHTIEQLFAH